MSLTFNQYIGAVISAANDKKIVPTKVENRFNLRNISDKFVEKVCINEQYVDVDMKDGNVYRVYFYGYSYWNSCQRYRSPKILHLDSKKGKFTKRVYPQVRFNMDIGHQIAKGNNFYPINPLANLNLFKSSDPDPRFFILIRHLSSYHHANDTSNLFFQLAMYNFFKKKDVRWRGGRVYYERVGTNKKIMDHKLSSIVFRRHDKNCFLCKHYA